MKTEFTTTLRHVLCAVTLLAAMAPTVLQAQKGLNVAPFFDGRYNKDKKVISVTYRGDIVREGDKGLYRSLTFQLPHNAVADIEKAVSTDGRQAVGKSTINKGGHDLILCYTFAPLEKGGPLRQLIYKRGSKDIYLIYLESYASLDELRDAFRKK